MKRVLLDHCVPKAVRSFLTGFDVVTAYQAGWSDLANGALLAKVEESGFDLFVTADQNLRYQQNLAGRKVAILLLPTNTLNELRPLSNEIAEVSGRANPGDFLIVGKRTNS